MVSIRSIVLVALAGLAIGTTSASATLGNDKLRHLDNLDLLGASLGESTAAARALMTSATSSNDEEVVTPSPSSSQIFTSSPSVSSTSGGVMDLTGTTASPTALSQDSFSMSPTASPFAATEAAPSPFIPEISGAATSAILPGVVALVSVGVAVVASMGV